MRKYLSVLAAVLFTLLVLFPHHHHVGGSICVTVQRCSQDGRINDRHTRRCHDFHIDRHHLFVATGQRHGALFVNSFHGGAGPFPTPGFWNNTDSSIFFITLPGKPSCLAVGSIVASSEGRHWKRRGPPFVV